MSKKPVVNNNPAQYPTYKEGQVAQGFPSSGTQVYGEFSLPPQVTVPNAKKSKETL